MDFKKFCKKLQIIAPSFSDYIYNLPIEIRKLAQRKVEVKINSLGIEEFPMGLFLLKEWKKENFFKYQALIVSYEFYRNIFTEGLLADYLPFNHKSFYRNYVVVTSQVKNTKRLITKILDRFYKEGQISSVEGTDYCEVRFKNNIITITSKEYVSKLNKNNIIHISMGEVTLNNINEILNSPKLNFSNYCKRYLFSNSSLALSDEIPSVILTKKNINDKKLKDNEAVNFSGTKNTVRESRLFK